MANSLISEYLKKLVQEEIIPTLDTVPGVDFNQYFDLIESRFANPEVRDTVSRLRQDASNRLPKFILPIIQANLQQGNDCKGLALVIALWCRLCAAGGDPNSGIVIEDQPSAFLQMNDIFGTLGDKEVFVQHFLNWLKMLWDEGTSSTLKQYLY
ncbi:hypothetical protein GLIP_0018 [Aliiglaciecola lipolytica E3]|uniref:Mannitol dehydrogenase C-terminal domain-containing protein n=2 Tax=Aliiglaciecola TaxID=1406885 RepID=K6Y7P3_9ALTE|nr:hypothetical protein GLIP_0018 [Aliiglaciecola lipolytica E3]